MQPRHVCFVEKTTDFKPFELTPRELSNPMGLLTKPSSFVFSSTSL